MKNKRKYCPICGRKGLRKDGMLRFMQLYECKYCESKTVYPKIRKKSIPHATPLFLKLIFQSYLNAMNLQNNRYEKIY